jgi:hypothetical protein
MQRDLKSMNSPTIPPTTPPAESFSLVDRYSAAWSEHNLRIEQRQSVLQMYLGAAGVIYGFYFLSPAADKSEMGAFLTISITILTLASSLLMYLHNRVISQLTNFMKKCEKCAAQQIEASGGETDLFYFYARDTRKMDPFHERQRLYQRLVLAGILGGTNGYAIYLTWNKNPATTTVSTVICALAIFLMSFGLFRPSE